MVIKRKMQPSLAVGPIKYLRVARVSVVLKSAALGHQLVDPQVAVSRPLVLYTSSVARLHLATLGVVRDLASICYDKKDLKKRCQPDSIISILLEAKTNHISTAHFPDALLTFKFNRSLSLTCRIPSRKLLIANPSSFDVTQSVDAAPASLVVQIFT